MTVRMRHDQRTTKRGPRKAAKERTMKKTLYSASAPLALLLALALPAAPALAQCVLQPGAPGQNSQTLNQNFLTLVNDLYAIDFQPTHTMTIGGKTLQVPPWFQTSDNCNAS